MMKWREMLNSDCPRRDALGLSDRCDLICPDLPRCSDKLLARGAPLWRQSGPPLICALGNAGMVVSGASAPIVNSSSLGALNAGNCNRSASDMVFASGSPAEGAKRRDNGGKRLLGHNSFGHDAPGVEPSPGPPISLADSRVGALTLQQQGAPMAFKWNQGVERKAK